MKWFAIVTLLAAFPLGCADTLGKPPKTVAEPSKSSTKQPAKRKPAAPKAADKKRDAAIQRGLKFLAKQQQASGAWRLASHGDSTAVTSLAVMAFLAADHVPGKGPYGKHLNRAIDWVLKQQIAIDRRAGKETVILVAARRTHGPMYSHGISTLMLARAVELLDKDRAKRARDVLTKATRLIVKSQSIPKQKRHAGGWRYQASSRDSDLSVTAWQLLALRAAQDADCDIPPKSLDRAVAYVKSCRPQKSPGFSYQPIGSATPVRTGIGILLLETCGKHKSKEAIAAADFLLKRPLRKSETYFHYGLYYCTAGMYRIGDKHWDAQKKVTHDLLLPMQSKSGSWSGGAGERRLGPDYCTSLAVLALAVDITKK